MTRSTLHLAASAALGLAMAVAGGCGGARTERSTLQEDTMARNQEQHVAAALEITSSAFAAGQPIPRIHTCDGEDRSPHLAWSGVPAEAKSLALICDDPDAPAGTWTHWVIYGMPPATTELPEGIRAREAGLPSARQGTSDFQRPGYGGPCPPPGKPHRYFFRLYALDRAIDLEPGASRQELLAAMEGHVIARGELMGTYQRTR